MLADSISLALHSGVWFRLFIPLPTAVIDLVRDPADARRSFKKPFMRTARRGPAHASCKYSVIFSRSVL